MLSTKPFEVPRDLLARAKGRPAINMAIAGAGSVEVMQCVKSGIETGVLRPVLVGNRDKMEGLAAQCGLALAGIHIIEAENEEAIAKASVAAVRAGDAKAIMKGDIHTNTLLRAVLDKTLGLRTGSRLSHVFHMTIPDCDRVLYIADGAVNVAPDLATLGVIINNAISMAIKLGTACPRVAVLSASEVPDESVPSSILARDAALAAQAHWGEKARIQGPMALDIAISPKAALAKHMEGPVAGNADILIVPNIEMGNGLFKMMVHFMSAAAAGVVMGAACPIAVTSRSDPAQARLAAAIMCALLAQD